jgi:hypothetical protein
MKDVYTILSRRIGCPRSFVKTNAFPYMYSRKPNLWIMIASIRFQWAWHQKVHK